MHEVERKEGIERYIDTDKLKGQRQKSRKHISFKKGERLRGREKVTHTDGVGKKYNKVVKGNKKLKI